MWPCQVWFVCCCSLSHPFPVSASVSLFMSPSAPPFSNPACHGALAGSVHWQTPGKFCTLVSWKASPPPLSFRGALWSSLTPPAKRGLGRPLKMADRGHGCGPRRRGWKRVRGSTAVVHSSLRASVGVRFVWLVAGAIKKTDRKTGICVFQRCQVLFFCFFFFLFCSKLCILAMTYLAWKSRHHISCHH